MPSGSPFPGSPWVSAWPSAFPRCWPSSPPGSLLRKRCCSPTWRRCRPYRWPPSSSLPCCGSPGAGSASSLRFSWCCLCSTPIFCRASGRRTGNCWKWPGSFGCRLQTASAASTPPPSAPICSPPAALPWDCAGRLAWPPRSSGCAAAASAGCCTTPRSIWK